MNSSTNSGDSNDSIEMMHRVFEATTNKFSNIKNLEHDESDRNKLEIQHLELAQNDHSISSIDQGQITKETIGKCKNYEAKIQLLLQEINALKKKLKL